MFLPKIMHASQHDGNTWGKEILFICSAVQQVARAFNDERGRAFDIYVYSSQIVRKHVSLSSTTKARLVLPDHEFVG